MRKFLRLRQVLAVVAMCRSAWLARVSDGRAPPPIKVGLKIAVWPEDTIAEWQDHVSTHGEKVGTYRGRGETL